MRCTQVWTILNYPYQMLFFNAATGYAFTIFFAGFAFTITTLPKISRLPALVAGFVRVFKRHNPGMAKTPVFFTSFVATSARLFNKVEQTLCLSSKLPAHALAMLLLVIARAVAFVVAFPC